MCVFNTRPLPVSSAAGDNTAKHADAELLCWSVTCQASQTSPATAYQLQMHSHKMAVRKRHLQFMNMNAKVESAAKQLVATT